MGCVRSKSNGAETKEGFKKAPSIRERMVHPTPNGGAATNKLVDPKRELQKQCWSNTLKGDVTLYRDAKVKREKLLRKAQLKRERLAQNMSDGIMDEHERLSLVSSRSRGTSRQTSPGTGPRSSSIRTNGNHIPTGGHVTEEDLDAVAGVDTGSTPSVCHETTVDRCSKTPPSSNSLTTVACDDVSAVT